VARARNRGFPGRTDRSAGRSIALVVLAILAGIALFAARAGASPLGPVGDGLPVGDAAIGDGMLDDTDLDAEAADELTTTHVAGAPGAVVGRVPRATADDLARVISHVPPASAVVAAAYRSAGLAHDPAPGWRWRTRLAGLVPAVTVRDGRDAAWRDVSDPTIAYVSVFSVAAQWRLERLVFDANELRISAIEAGRRRDRRRVAATAIRTYYAWLQLRAAAEADPRWGLRADEAAAELDALTDGWFSQNLPATPPPGHAYRE
jgi:hypothetical protein